MGEKVSQLPRETPKHPTIRASNSSFVLEKAGSVKYEDRPIPELKSPYDVLVNVKFTGIC
ncbi:putative D-xylulose reductase A, partial [Cryomyces minteri]